MGMLYLTKTPDLVVKVNNREGMGVEKLVNATAINVIQRVYKFKSTKKLNMTFRLHPVIIVNIERVSIIDLLYVNKYINFKVQK